MIKNRIKSHRRVRAGDLLPHEFNFRHHPDNQKRALEALYSEIGFARSLLAYELPDGSLKLIDGHLRRDIDPDMEVDVDVLDVNDDEARALLLSIDPLASLAVQQEQLQARLLELTPTENPELKQMWEQTVTGLLQTPPKPFGHEVEREPLRYFVLIPCRGEMHQRELLQRFRQEGIDCEAKMG
jgi:hypothetical protein